MEQGLLPTSFVAWLTSGKESFFNGLSASDAGRCGDRAGQRKSTKRLHNSWFLVAILTTCAASEQKRRLTGSYNTRIRLWTSNRQLHGAPSRRHGRALRRLCRRNSNLAIKWMLGFARFHGKSGSDSVESRKVLVSGHCGEGCSLLPASSALARQRWWT